MRSVVRRPSPTRSARRDLDDVAVHLVVPVRVSHLHFLTDDESRERRQAEGSLARTLWLLHECGVVATGAVGDDKPLESMTDALGRFAATHVLLAIPPERESYWLERELLPKARALAAVEVKQIVVPAASAAALGALQCLSSWALPASSSRCSPICLR